MHYAIRALRAKGSGEWFVNEINQWLKAASSDVLICHGMRMLLVFMHSDAVAGAGKSFLMYTSLRTYLICKIRRY